MGCRVNTGIYKRSGARTLDAMSVCHLFSYSPSIVCTLSLQRLANSRSHLQIPKIFAYFPLENDTTAHLPLHAHFLEPLSPPPPSIARSSSSCPGLRPTTTSALHVRSASTLTPDPGPRSPMASVKGVAGSHSACERQFLKTTIG